LDEYDGFCYIRTAHAKVDGVFIEDENTQGQLEEQIAKRAFKIGKQRQDLEDWAARHANAPHFGAPIDYEDDLFIVNSQRRAMLLNNDNTRHGEQEVDKKNEIHDSDLKDTGTSPATPDKVAASEERHAVQENALPTIPASPLHNHSRVQSSEKRALA
jgi:hypothetical protein